MSIEFRSRLDAPLSAEMVELIRDDLIRRSGYSLVRDAAKEIGLNSGSHNMVSATEDVTLLFDPNEFYVAFHVASREQRNAFLLCCSDVFKQNDLRCNLEEI